MTVFLDTNVLAYQYDDSVADKQQRAREVFSPRTPPTPSSALRSWSNCMRS